MTLRIGDVYRYPRLREAKLVLKTEGELPVEVDGLPNLLSITVAPDGTLKEIDAGYENFRMTSSIPSAAFQGTSISSRHEWLGS